MVVSLAACFIAIVYGLSFDMEAAAAANEDNPNADMYSTDCWNSSLNLRIENALSLDEFTEEYEEQNEMNSSSYAGSDSASWLLSLGQSLLLSLILWQPLTYVLHFTDMMKFTKILQVLTCFTNLPGCT